MASPVWHLQLPRRPQTYSQWRLQQQPEQPQPAQQQPEQPQPPAQQQPEQPQPPAQQQPEQPQPPAQQPQPEQPQPPRARIAAASAHHPRKEKFIYANSIGVTAAANPSMQPMHDLAAFAILAAALPKREDTPPVSHMPGVWLRQIECSYSPGENGDTDKNGTHTITGVATGAHMVTLCSQEGSHMPICHFKFTLKAGVIEGRPDVEKYTAHGGATAHGATAHGLDRDIYMAVHQRALQAIAAAGYLRELPGCVRPPRVETRSV